MSGLLSPVPVMKFFDNNGAPLAFGQVFTYQAGTTTPAPTYVDSTLTTQNQNPIILNFRGECEIWIPANTAYKFNVEDANGNQIPGWPQDQIQDQLYVPTQQGIGQLIYPQTATEIAAGVTPTKYWYPPGNPRRYGAVGDNTADDTVAVQNCINSNNSVIFNEGDNYSVTTVIFPNAAPTHVDFNGATLFGRATAAADCIMQIESSFANFYNVSVFNTAPIGQSISPNPNYKCAILWYNTSGGGSQFTSLFGCLITCAQRGMVYGALPGMVATGGIQSENSIYGFRTVGNSNPFYMNAVEGFVYFADPIFYSGFEDWTTTLPQPTQRALEMYGGALFAQGGELEIASSATGFAADLQNCTLVGMYLETAAPIQIVGDGLNLVGCTHNNTQSTTAGFKVLAGTTGAFRATGGNFLRGTGTGVFSRVPLVDASTAGQVAFTGALASGAVAATLSAAFNVPNQSPSFTIAYNLTFSDGEVRYATFQNGSTAVTWATPLTAAVSANATLPFETVLQDSASTEWPWVLAGSNCRLVQGGQVSYRNHRYNSTAGDPNTYLLNTSPTESMIPELTLDALGYTTTGWILNVSFGGGSALNLTTSAGPTGYLAAQLQLVATGISTAQNGDPTSLTTIKATMQRVRPGELYWIAGWINPSSGTACGLMANFYTLAGAANGTTAVTDGSALTLNTWTYVEGPFVVPAGTAYMAIGVLGNVTTFEFTDIRVRRAN